MKVLVIYAHPEASSLNGALRDHALQHLRKAGHEVQLSDLYAMNWKATLDAADFPERDPSQPFHPSLDSKLAYANGSQSADIAAEQAKLEWADAVIFQFPLWWFSVPAVMKGWFDRVYAYGFAYGVGEHSDHHWGDRYGEGKFAGKRAMLLVTTGGWASHYSARGINGPIDDILFPIQHGLLFYPGFSVLEPMVVYRTSKVDEARYGELCSELEERLDTLQSAQVIPYRRQNHGDYAIPALELKDHIKGGEGGFAIHLAD